MTEAAIIIHTRTKFCDFPSALAVSPSVLNREELTQVRKKILETTRAIDNLHRNEVRMMIYSFGDYVVAGMTSFLNCFADYNTDSSRYFVDEKGRNIYAFIGFVFKKNMLSTPSVDKNTLWNCFIKYMAPIWEDSLLETQYSSFEEMSFCPKLLGEHIDGEMVSDLRMYHLGNDDVDVFSYWLEKAIKGEDISFCSNITDFRVVKEKSFHIITTTNNIIERARIELAYNASDKIHMPSDVDSRLPCETDKKKIFSSSNITVGLSSLKNFCPIVVVLLLVIILIILVLK